MAVLKLAALAAALVLAAPARTETVADWRAYVAEASRRFGVPVAWIERVMAAESGGRTSLAGRPVVSRAGAMGLMQVMPDTWAAMRAAYDLGDDPFDPHDNIIAGTAYLRMMYDRFGYPGLFAAYNAGPGRYSDYLVGRRSLPGETRAYVATIAGIGAEVGARKAPTAQPDLPTLFVTLTRRPESKEASADDAAVPTAAPPPALFVISRAR